MIYIKNSLAQSWGGLCLQSLSVDSEFSLNVMNIRLHLKSHGGSVVRWWPADTPGTGGGESEGEVGRLTQAL